MKAATAQKPWVHFLFPGFVLNVLLYIQNSLQRETFLGSIRFSFSILLFPPQESNCQGYEDFIGQDAAGA